MMQTQVTFIDLDESPIAKKEIEKRIKKLERHFKRIVRCEVRVTCPHHHRSTHRLYHVEVSVVIPGEDVIVSHNHSDDEAHKDMNVAIRDAFNAADRILHDKMTLLHKRVRTATKPLVKEKGEDKILS
jgi:ribosomal subunit interface protein